MKKFLAHTAQTILEKHGNNLSDVLVLMPNQRSCTYFRNELKRLANTAIFSPEISTLQDWMLAQSELVVADSIGLVSDLFACHKAIGGELTLDEFIGIANILLRDFDELDLQMADAKSFFRNLEMLQSMKTYEPGEEPTEYVTKYRRFWEDFGKLYSLLRQSLLANKRGYRGMILRQVAENISELSLPDKRKDSPVYLVGFSGLNKTDEVMITHLIAHTNAEVLWDADSYYVNDDMKEAGLFFRKYKSAFRTGSKVFTNGISSTAKNIQVVGAAKNVGQVKVVADILQNQLQLDDASAMETVIVVPDEKLLQPLIANLPDNIKSLNITMGLTIAGSNSATFLDILFRLYHNSQKFQSKNRAQRFYYKDVFDLLQHNYFRMLFGQVSIEHFLNAMKKRNRVLIRKEELDKAFGGLVSAMFFEGEDARLYADYLAHILRALLDQLVKRARQGDTTMAAETEITFRLLSIINNTQSIFAGGETISINTYIALLKENFRETRVPLEGDPVQGLQIMGLQETRSLDFKNVIILSMNEGILPAGKNIRSYIPFELRREFLTTHKERDAVTAYLFYRLLHQAENVFLLYNTEPDELGGGEKSRFILQLQQELQRANPTVKITDSIFAIDPPAAIDQANITIPKTEKVLQKMEDIFSTSGLSPSALNTYIHCSLQYYFRYIAGLREEDDMEENIEAATIGSAVHYALEKIYGLKVGETITEEFIELQVKNKQQIENLIRENLAERFDKESLTSGKNYLLFKVCVKLTEEFLKQEKKNILRMNDEGQTLAIEMLEGKIEYLLFIKGKHVKITGRVDRIERVGGVVQIADYKTSKYSTIPVLTNEVWDELMIDPKYSKPVQLMVYALLYNRMQGKDVPVRSGIYWLRESNKNLDTVRIDKSNDILDAKTLQKFEDKLQAVLAAMLNSEIPFEKTKDETRCKHCDFKTICQR